MDQAVKWSTFLLGPLMNAADMSAQHRLLGTNVSVASNEYDQQSLITVPWTFLSTGVF